MGMKTAILYPDRDDLPEVPPIHAVFVAAVEWAWGGRMPDRRDEYWLSRHGDAWLLWISGEDEDGDACHIVYALSDDAFATASEAAARLLEDAWRAEGHDRFAFLVHCGLLPPERIEEIAGAVWDGFDPIRERRPTNP